MRGDGTVAALLLKIIVQAACFDFRKRCAKLRPRQLRFEYVTLRAAMTWAVDSDGSENDALVTVVVALLRRCGRAGIEAKTCRV